MRTSYLTSAALLVGFSACNLSTCAQQLQSQQLMVGTVLATPAVTFSPALSDGGLTPDAGAFVDGGFTLPAGTAAFVFFGQRSSTSLDQPPSPIPGATVTVTPVGGAAVTLTGDGQGDYQTDSAQNPAFQYQPGATYDFSAAYSGDTYVGEVPDAPDREAIPEFHPPNGYVSLAAGTPFTFSRQTPDAGQDMNLGFVEVFPVDASGHRGVPTYDNAPQTPLAFLQLIAAPSPWKQTSVTLPGSAFPNGQSTYVIVFESVKNGGPKSANLFTGSALLAGSADVAVVLTQ